MIVNFADDNTLNDVYLLDAVSVLALLKSDMDKIVDCFSIHFLKVNAEKYRFLLSVKVFVNDMQLSNIALGNGDRVSLLRVNESNGLNFDYHVTHLWKKAR